MSSKIETGNAKNLAAFHETITYCKGYGAAYNPGNSALSIASLDLQHATAMALLDDCKAKQISTAIAIDDRMKQFGKLKTYATRIMNAIIAAGADKLTIETAKTFNRKIQGQRAAKQKVPTDPNQPNPISVAQLSFDNLIEHLKGLIGLVALLPNYQPNENELKLTGLNSYIDLLKGKNLAVIQATADFSNARLTRDNAFYELPDSLANTMLGIKAYVKSVFGASSSQFKQISSIRFLRR